MKSQYLKNPFIGSPFLHSPFIAGQATSKPKLQWLFNGIPDASATFAGGGHLVRDYTGTLIQVPVGMPAIEGARLATTLEEGAELGPEMWTAGDIVSTGDEGTFKVLSSPNGLTPGANYCWEATTSNTTAGQWRFQIGTEYPLITTTNGHFTGVDTALKYADLAVRTGNAQQIGRAHV